jgi:hypothetical protein
MIKTYPTTKKSKQKEHHKGILQNNEYNTSLPEKPLSQSRNKTYTKIKHTKKWATFTYCRKEIRKINKLLRTHNSK